MQQLYSDKKGHIFITIFLSACAFLINYLINFFITPYITNNLGAETYGFISLAKTLVNYATIITLMLNSYATRYISIAYHSGDMKTAIQYYSSVFYANIFLSIFISIIAFYCIYNLSDLLQISSGIIPDIKLLFIFVFITFFITTAGTTFSAAAYIKNHLDKVNIYTAIAYLLQALVIIIMFTFLTPKVWYVAVGFMTTSIVIFYGNFHITKKVTPELKINRKSFSIKHLKLLVINGIWNSINGLGNIMNSGLDLLITNKMLSPLLMGELSIAKTVGAIFSSLYVMVAQPFQPIFLKNYAAGNKNDLLKDLKFSMKISGLLSNLAFALFVSLGLSYYKLWIPGQNISLIYKLTVITILTSISEGAVYPLYYIYTLTIKNRVPCIITLLGGGLNVIFMYILIKYTSLGIYSVAITTAIIMNFINAVTNPLYMAKCLNTKLYEFYPTFIRHIISCIIMTLVLKYIADLFTICNWFHFIIILCVEGFIGLVLHLLIMFNFKDLLYYLRKNLKIKG